jgi:hypothetical protein
VGVYTVLHGGKYGLWPGFKNKDYDGDKGAAKGGGFCDNQGWQRSDYKRRLYISTAGCKLPGVELADFIPQES